LYSGVDVYTGQLRKLEAFCQSNPASAQAHFVLAYHYMTQGNNDAAAAQFKRVVALSPENTLAAQLLRVVSPAAEVTETQPAPEVAAATPSPAPGPSRQGDLTGAWHAQPAPDTSINLRIGGDATFTWTVTQKGKPHDITGKWSLADDILTMAQSGQGDAMVGRMSWQDENRWNFKVMGAGPDDPGLVFTR
jgi:hypothetical protein